MLTKLNHNAFLCFYLAVGLFWLLGLTRKGLRPGTLKFNLRRKKIKAMLPHLSSGLLAEITWRKEIQSCKKRNLCCVYFFFLSSNREWNQQRPWTYKIYRVSHSTLVPYCTLVHSIACSNRVTDSLLLVHIIKRSLLNHLTLLSRLARIVWRFFGQNQIWMFSLFNHSTIFIQFDYLAIVLNE